MSGTIIDFSCGLELKKPFPWHIFLKKYHQNTIVKKYHAKKGLVFLGFYQEIILATSINCWKDYWQR